MTVTVMIMKVESLENNKTFFSEKVMNSDKMMIIEKEKLLSDGMSFAEVINNYSVDVTERSFVPSFLSFLESDFALLWYKTLHSEVAWTEENAGKSGFTLFAAWLITLHRVLWCQNTIKISITKRAKQG